MGGLIVAAALTVAVADFDVEGASSFIGRRLPAMTADAVNAAGCGKAMADELGAAIRKDFVDCLGSATCLVSVGRTLPVDRVVTGSLRGTDGSLVVQFRIIEMSLPPVQRRITRRLPARPDALKEALRQSGPALCAALTASPGTKDTELELPPLELPPLDLPPLVADAVEPASEDLDLALDLPIEAPSTPAVALATPAAPVAAPVVEAPTFDPLPEIPMTPEPVASAPVAVAIAPPKEVPVTEQSRAKKAVEASTRPLPAKVEKPVEIPWAWVGVVSGAVLGLVGGGLGIGSAVIAGKDEPQAANGFTRHSITRADAQTANALATGAALLFGVGVAAGGAGAAGLMLGDAR